ncbi:MAG: V-type ATP synthase subunit K [Candidatus Scalindua sp.]|jgi:V/A-type H+-transporting ATPase subunit K|nr:V-type ATP synthase subunit K [Candidatus Scalindua sp.]MBT5307035.1 V-type ATP synthase subunit K [Candidatus Scalindua sp.]MBT6227251.1 V-type ATP synthase subunit K [Candidatus Scalindua sp.]MBT6564562.1 V-type ATP synthase subunit K [Candidatus Scalindua sp.]MBT7211574.1 V-type ATP synthase subunit K [Candidatus Scalindua sp.]
MSILEGLGSAGYVLALCLAASGSAFGTGAAGMATLGAWKKCFLQNKNAQFILVAFVGAPLSQTIYGMILMNAIRSAPDTVHPLAKFTIGLMGGLAMGISALLQGKAGAKAADALAETKKGFGNYIMVLGIIETVALFVMVFLMTTLR